MNWNEILNAFLGEYQADEIDTEYYNLRKIKLLDICHDKEETLVRDISLFQNYNIISEDQPSARNPQIYLSKCSTGWTHFGAAQRPQ